MNKWLQWNERTRLLLTLELAVCLPAAALIGVSVWKLKSMKRDKVVEAAIQRDFQQMLKIGEKRVNKRAYAMISEVRADFPGPDEPVAQKLDQIFSPVVPPLERIWRCFADFREEQQEIQKKHGRVLGCPIHSLGAEVSTVDERLRNKLQEILAQFIRYYESAIRDAHFQAIIEAPDAPALARILFAYGEGLLLHARIWNDLSYLDEIEAGARRILGVKDVA